MVFFRTFLFVCCALVCQLPAAEQERRCFTLDADPVSAKLADIADDWTFTFAVDGQEREVAGRRLVRWGAYRDDDSGAQVVLADGGVLVAEILSIDDDTLSVYSDVFGELAIPLAQVAGMVLEPPMDPLRRDLLLDQIRTAAGTQDRLLMENGDVVQGVISEKPRVGPRSADDVLTKINIRLPSADEPVAIRYEKITAVIFDPALRKTPSLRGLRCGFGLDDGSLLWVAKVQTKRSMMLRLVCGLEIDTDLETVVDVTVCLQPLGGDCLYLSDLKVIDYKHIPFLQRRWEYQPDRNVLGGRLRAGAELTLKGVGMHSTSRLVYSVPKGVTRLEGQLAIDDQAGQGGSVLYRVFVNRPEEGWQTVFRSEPVRGGARPAPLSVDVANARGVMLVVEFADQGDVLDYADWLNLYFAR